MLRKGETVITDGEHMARTRCGNRLAEAPTGPVMAANRSWKQPRRKRRKLLWRTCLCWRTCCPGEVPLTPTPTSAISPGSGFPGAGLLVLRNSYCRRWHSLFSINSCHTDNSAPADHHAGTGNTSNVVCRPDRNFAGSKEVEVLILPAWRSTTA